MHLHLSESRHIAGDRPREQELFAYSLISWVLLPPPPRGNCFGSPGTEGKSQSHETIKLTRGKSPLAGMSLAHLD